ncbi:hypothetical protein [Clostridium sp. FP1]|uniref:hypothetical protein n=1 Tax=Clostridium sp. FP1 TaxID=2724076 RepID=UPI0013E90E7D|nr:hypothetical protein [Clostridium sp. FP1]MBZ9634556.1 hypothetical protein [Clostridium sp. FP1]
MEKQLEILDSNLIRVRPDFYPKLNSLKSLETLTISQTQKDIDFKLDNVRITTVMN